MAIVYTAHVREVPGEGIRLEPTGESTAPGNPNDVNLLGMAVALALGSVGYEHHPEPRDPQLQTMDALLAGEATMPWRPGTSGSGDAAAEEPRVVCERTPKGVYRCEVRAGAEQGN